MQGTQPGVFWRHRRGQVLVEFALAAAGLIAMALVTARVAYWMNQSLVERSAQYQSTRTQAGQRGAGLVDVGSVPDVHLIGPGPARTSPATSQPPDSFQPACDDGGLWAKARRIRQVDVPGLHEELQDLRQRVFDSMNESKRLWRQRKDTLEEARRLEDEVAPDLDRRSRTQVDEYCKRPIYGEAPEGEERPVIREEEYVCGSREEINQDLQAQAQAARDQARDLNERVAPELERQAIAANEDAIRLTQRMPPLSIEAHELMGKALAWEWQGRAACASGPSAL